MRSLTRLKGSAYLYGPTYYAPKVKMCGISNVETIPAIIDAKPRTTWALYLRRANWHEVTVEQAKTLVEELHKQYVKYGTS